MNMVSSSKAPYLLHAERSGQPRETYGNRFRDTLEKEKAKNNITESAAEIAVNEMDKVRKENAASGKKDELFREQYEDTGKDA